MNGFLTLESGSLRVVVSPQGGAVVEAWYGAVPLLRPYAAEASAAFDVLKAGMFPLVPFGNRVVGNAFTFDGRTYRLAANTNGDRHYLHGDGWLGLWSPTTHSQTQLDLTFRHAASRRQPLCLFCRQSRSPSTIKASPSPFP